MGRVDTHTHAVMNTCFKIRKEKKKNYKYSANSQIRTDGRDNGRPRDAVRERAHAILIGARVEYAIEESRLGGARIGERGEHHQRTKQQRADRHRKAALARVARATRVKARQVVRGGRDHDQHPHDELRNAEHVQVLAVSRAGNVCGSIVSAK